MIMAVEAIVPVITVVIPTGIDLVAGYFSISVPWLGPVRKTIMCIAPLLNPIMKISIVSCYRAYVLRYIGISTTDPTRSKIFTAISKRSHATVSVHF